MNRVICLAEDNGIDIFYQDTDSMHLEDNKVKKLAELFFKKYNTQLIGKQMGQFHTDFKADGFNVQVMKLNFGKQLIEAPQLGAINIYFKKLDEHITINKPGVQVKNIVKGTRYIDIEGKALAINHKTGERIEQTFFPKKGKAQSYIKGMAFDSQGKERIEISGSWLSEYKLKDLQTGSQETIWKEPAPIPDAHLQFFFNEVSIMMNDKSENMRGIVSPTDSRWRNDMRLYE